MKEGLFSMTRYSDQSEILPEQHALLSSRGIFRIKPTKVDSHAPFHSARNDRYDKCHWRETAFGSAKKPSFDKEGFGGFVDIREAAATGENALWTTIRIDLPVRKTFRFVDTA